jgi:hypothetical protein
MTTPDVCQVPTAAAIPLHGKHAVGETAYALVDFTDAEKMFTWRRTAVPGYSTFYAQARIQGATASMHRVLLGMSRGNCRTNDVDHCNGNGLDNRRRNLRICTHSENACNRGRSSGRSGYKGVSWDSWQKRKGASKAWKSYIKLDGRRRHLGYFTTAQEAADAYDREAVRLFGPFARTNASITTNPALAPRMNAVGRVAARQYQRERYLRNRQRGALGTSGESE